MKTGRDYKFWFCTGSQDLYGDECLRKVAEHSKIIVEELNKSGVLPFEVVWKPTQPPISRVGRFIAWMPLMCIGFLPLTTLE